MLGLSTVLLCMHHYLCRSAQTASIAFVAVSLCIVPPAWCQGVLTQGILLTHILFRTHICATWRWSKAQAKWGKLVKLGTGCSWASGPNSFHLARIKSLMLFLVAVMSVKPRPGLAVAWRLPGELLCAGGLLVLAVCEAL